MKRKFVVGFVAAFLLFGMTGLAQAALSVIGSAEYQGASYNMVYDDDLELTWLDYTHKPAVWLEQMNWAQSLNNAGELTYTFSPNIAMSWTDGWRLPDPHKFDGSGLVVGYPTDTEAGHLFWEELDKGTQLGEYFQNILPKTYWCNMSYDDDPTYAAWVFTMGTGRSTNTIMGPGYSLAVRPGKVSAVPIPAAVWLLGSGLVGLVGARRKFNK